MVDHSPPIAMPGNGTSISASRVTNGTVVFGYRTLVSSHRCTVAVFHCIVAPSTVRCWPSIGVYVNICIHVSYCTSPIERGKIRRCLSGCWTVDTYQYNGQQCILLRWPAIYLVLGVRSTWLVLQIVPGTVQYNCTMHRFIQQLRTQRISEY